MTQAVETSQLAQLIRHFRLAAGLSQEELAERSGVSARAVSDMERGLRTAPRLETVRMLADGLNLSDADRTALLAAARPDTLRTSASPGSGMESAPTPRATVIPLRLQPLPVPPDQLIGREKDVDEIVSLLTSDRIRLVTLTGPGGVGKTRLSLAAASHLSSRFVDGVAFVDLAPLTEAELVAPAITNAMGTTVDPQMHPREALLATLRDRSLLLVLDNFEHLLDAASLISDLLVACPSLKVLVTSRVRLRLRGEHVYPVPPLPVPERAIDSLDPLLPDLSRIPSVQLFVDRAREADFGFALDAENAAAIAGICRRLDGLPLAIELAASRVGLLPPATLLERLDRRLPALTAGARDAPARQRTLGDAIAWSYDLLGPREQTVFRRLSVFAGGFTLDAAESVAGDQESDVPAAIETLAESSLLSLSRSAPGKSRFTMLDTIHEYAASLLEQSGEAVSVRRRHAEWSIQLAEFAGNEMANSRNLIIWFRKLDVEQANIRSGIDFMLGSGDGAGVLRLLTGSQWYWHNRPYPRDLRHWVEAAISLNAESPGHALVFGLHSLAWAAAMLGDLEYASACADRALQLAEKIGTPHALGAAYYDQAMIAEFTGQVERAAENLERSLPWLREADNPAGALDAMVELGGKWALAGKLDQAVAILDESLKFARQTGSEVVLAYGLTNRAFAGLAQNDPVLAARLFVEGIAKSQELRMDRTVLAAIGGLAGVALALGQADRGARLLGAVEAARQSSGVGRIGDAASVEPISSAIRDRLGQEAFEDLLREGSRMTYQEAVDAALEIGSVAASDNVSSAASRI